MRPLAIVGLVLIVVGMLALGYQGVTFMTREAVAEVGPATLSWGQALWLHPATGAVPLATGLLLFVYAMRRRGAAG